MTIGVHKAKIHLSELLRRVQNGETITIERYGKPIARLVSIPEKSSERRPLGLWEQTWDVPEEAFTPETDATVANLFSR